MPEGSILIADDDAAIRTVINQALSRAGIVTADRRVKGGYRLGRAPAKISLLDIVLAIECQQPAFRCTEIRQRGPCAAPPSACRKACPI